MKVPRRFKSLRAWLFVVMAVIGAALGVLAGMHTVEPAVAAAISKQRCPTALDINSHVITNVSEKAGRLDISSTLEVRLQGVKPPDPNSASPALIVSYCLLPGAGQSLQFLDWSKGSLTARFTVRPSVIIGAPRSDDVWSPVIAETGFRHSTLKVALCDQPRTRQSPIQAFLGFGDPLVCNQHSQTIIEVRLPTPQPGDSSGYAPVPEPDPQHVERKDNNVTYIWSFPGPPPTTPVTVSVNLPFQGLAAEFLNHPSHLARTFNVRFFAYSFFPVLALLIGWCVLWRSSAGWRLAGIALAALVLGNLGLNPFSVVALEIGVAIAWLIVLLSVVKTRRWAVAGTVAAAIAVLMVLLVPDPHRPDLLHPPHHPDLLHRLQMVALAAAFMVLVLTAVVALFRRLMRAFDLRNDTKETDYQFRNTITCVGIVGLSFLYGFDLSGLPDVALHGLIAPGSLAGWIAAAVIKGSQFGGWPLAQLGALIVVAFLAVKLNSQQGWAKALPAALMFGLAAPWSQNGDDVVVAVISGLLWPLQVLIIWIGFQQLLKRKVAAVSEVAAVPVDKQRLPEAARGATSKSPSPTPCADSGVRIQLRRWEVRFTLRRRHQQPPPAAPDGVDKDSAPANVAGDWRLQAGPQNTALENAHLAAKRAGYLSVPLVLYFVWTTLGQLHDVLRSDSGMLIVFIGLVTEAARWVVSGFVFGFLYERIPGKIGPAKAACFVGLWVMSCLVPTAIARGLSVDLTQHFIYRSAQFALFILILAVLIDYATVKSAGDKWQDLRTVYSAQNYGEFVTVIAPVALLTVTLAQQILAGSGFDVAESFLGGIDKVIPTK